MYQRSLNARKYKYLLSPTVLIQNFVTRNTILAKNKRNIDRYQETFIHNTQLKHSEFQINSTNGN